MELLSGQQLKSLEVKEKQSEKEEKPKERKIETSAEKLRKLLKEEKRLKKKRKRSASSSSTSSESSSDSSESSSSSSHRKHKKRRKHSESSSHSRKSSSKVFIHEKDSHLKDEWYPPPANTSASFLDKKQEMEKILEKQDRLVCQTVEGKEKGQYRSLSSSSAELVESFAGRSEDSRDSHCSSKSQTSSSKAESQVKMDRIISSKWDSPDSSHRQSDSMHKAYHSRKLDKAGEATKEAPRKRESRFSSDYKSKYDDKFKNSQHAASWRTDNQPARYTSILNEEEIGDKKYNQGRGRESLPARGVKDEKTSNSKGNSDGTVCKKLPPNLLNIFSQIAEFQKEKGSKSKDK